MMHLLLLSQLALATQIELGTVPCPIGGEPTQIARLISKDSLNGWDDDGARYSQGGQWREKALATCPSSLLSLYNRDMVRPLTDAEKTRLLPVISKQKQLNGDALHIWDRYELAANAYLALGRDPWFIAQLYLQGSWTVRDAMVKGAPPVQGQPQGAALLVAVETELKKDLSDSQQKVLLFNAAKIAQRIGQPPVRERYIQRLDALISLNETERAALQALKRLPAVEARLQRACLTQLNRWRASSSPNAEGLFLMGELHRRLGQFDKAKERLIEAKGLKPKPVLAERISDTLNSISAP